MPYTEANYEKAILQLFWDELNYFYICGLSKINVSVIDF